MLAEVFSEVGAHAVMVFGNLDLPSHELTPLFDIFGICAERRNSRSKARASF